MEITGRPPPMTIRGLGLIFIVLVVAIAVFGLQTVVNLFAVVGCLVALLTAAVVLDMGR